MLHTVLRLVVWSGAVGMGIHANIKATMLKFFVRFADIIVLVFADLSGCNLTSLGNPSG